MQRNQILQGVRLGFASSALMHALVITVFTPFSDNGTYYRQRIRRKRPQERKKKKTTKPNNKPKTKPKTQEEEREFQLHRKAVIAPVSS